MPSEKSPGNSLKKPFVITGRTGRAGFWRFFFLYIGIVLALVLVPSANDTVALVVSAVLMVLLLLAAIRRLRDAGMSGWFLLLALVPLVGQFALFGLLVRPGTPGTDTPSGKARGPLRGTVEGIRQGFRFIGAILDYLVTVMMWAGQGMNGPITHYCLKCHRRTYPAGSLYCDNCLLDKRWGEGEP